MPVINEEKVKNRLDEILARIQTEVDPDLLNQYRSLIRKKVSFFQRSYLAAYLLMLQDQTGGRRSQRSGSRETSRNKNGRDNSSARGNGQTEGTEQNRQPLPEDESVRLFISIGRNRRIFPREILGIIGAKTAVSKDDIGIINILNNYSFVQVRSSVAEEIIAALNGINFRGRTLAVNYARSRKEEDEDASAEQPLEKLSLNGDTDTRSGFDDTFSAESETGAENARTE
ncbi:MAG: DbpA RNA binding domain-containing protein [Treponema sp.]|jgi:hypothetical protein|nr:DbpA RNA binding domain-containing protein [Treponema sp.]